MQQLQHKQFTTLPTGRQVRNEQSALRIRYCYVPLSAGFTAIGKVSDNDKIRPWFKRQEA
ncbi:hypothetical protein [Ferruginibacter sp.]|nr:hypothetical protein [Ferruginibacter sp.]